jgi:hypothetical protein
MQQLCAYEVCMLYNWRDNAHILQTVALGYSSFCDLFTEEEWIGYSYLNGRLIRPGKSPPILSLVLLV